MKKLITIIAVVVALAGGQALAQPGETLQVWTFDADDNPTVPEINLNPYGSAMAFIGGPSGAAPPEWIANLLGREGVWTGDAGFTIALDIPNQMIPNPYKEIRVEIGFLGNLDGFPDVYPSGGRVVAKTETVEMVDPATGWQKLTASYRIEPNPDKELIFSYFSKCAAVDYVSVYTVCVPEPLTISLLGFGGLMVWRRRRAAS